MQDAHHNGTRKRPELGVSRALPGVPDGELSGVGTEALGPDEAPTSLVQELQGITESLFLLMRSQAVECEVLWERLRRTEAELEMSESIADTLYTFFSTTTRRVANDKRELKTFTADQIAELLGRDLGEEGRARG